MKKLFSLLLVLGLLAGVTPALADGPDGPPMPMELPAWSNSEVADCYALGLFGDEIYIDHDNVVTMEQLETITKIVADKLALLGVEQRSSAGSFVLDTTRGGVLNALYMEALPYAFEGIDAGPVEFLSELGVVNGDGAGLALDRPCTRLETCIFAQRLVLALYDRQNAGSLGLLWKAEGNGNTLYLLGSIHTDRNNLYPFHKQLRDVITGAELAAFELDFNDEAGLAEFAAMQVYADGTTLKDHIAPELYQKTVDALAPLGLDEETAALYKPWALANTFNSLALLDETTSGNAMAIDLYVNAKASNVGVPVAGVETYAFQGGIFDELSAEYQENYLALTLAMYLGEYDGMDEEAVDAINGQSDAVGQWMDQWKARDIEGFNTAYPKDEIMAEDSDELNRKMFEDRDPNMAAWADSFLKQEGSHTGLMTVGAGHMIGSTGIVQRLKDMGYTVEPVMIP